jgi:hypothetical protein
MEALEIYEPQVDNWELKPVNEHMGYLKTQTNIILGLSPPTPERPDCIYFNGGFRVVEYNITTNKIIFQTDCVQTITVRNNSQCPSKDYLHGMLEIMIDNCFRFFVKKAEGTIMQNAIIPPPSLQNKLAAIEDAVLKWNAFLKDIRDS